MPITPDKAKDLIKFEPNILDFYESYTYNFSLSLYGQEVLAEVGLPKLSDQFVTIVESGVTSNFFIKRVEILSNPSVNRENGGVNDLTITMDIDEPLGFTFIDRLLVAAKSLKLPTIQNAPFILDLVFIGWDKSGSSRQIVKKSWRLNLLNVTPDFVKTGTKYSLKFTLVNDLVQDMTRFLTPKQIVFVKAPKLVDT